MAIGLIEVAEGEHMAPLTRADTVNALIADCPDSNPDRPMGG